MVPTLLHQRGPKISFGARPSRTSDAPRCRCCPKLRHIEGAGGARWPRTIGWHTLPMVYKTARPGAKGAGGSSCKRRGTGTIHSLLGRIPNMHAMVSEFYLWDGSLLGTEQVTVSELYLLGMGKDSLRRFVYLGMARRIIAGMDCQSTSGNLIGGGGHRRAGMHWAWAVPWITPGCSISVPP
ncbi:hypothetical protein GOBAR_AA09765 [Gossypium barbadense]|uniref:Uncharacterized protein n=1 Tax=Gossypium barbadense TaxID=3634 RepID=A0A2P5Y5L0_GOSBA|nr:hypothetical protein GOBAR_AA09765 [Gossypium barbadense]